MLTKRPALSRGTFYMLEPQTKNTFCRSERVAYNKNGHRHHSTSLKGKEDPKLMSTLNRKEKCPSLG